VSPAGEVLVGLTIAVGLVGVVVPLLPGVSLVWAAILVWALVTGSAVGWATFAAATFVLLASQVAKYVLPGRRLTSAGVPRWTLLAGAVAGIVGFFVIPVIGLFIGFPLGVYVAELLRLRSWSTAWPSTRSALQAVGLSLAIELLGACLATGIWIVVVIAGG
jgi:uncharacterized protein YqgC (DUF456 family)